LRPRKRKMLANTQGKWGGLWLVKGQKRKNKPKENPTEKDACKFKKNVPTSTRKTQRGD